MTSLFCAKMYTTCINIVREVSNGNFLGNAGYPRGNVLRSSPAFNDGAMTYLLPPSGRPYFSQSDLICKYSQETKHNQTKGSPRLGVEAGSTIALRYQENGHITMPKKLSMGSVSIYGTARSAPTDTLLGIHGVWNANGTGDDGRGVLLDRSSFDDGSCYQKNTAPISLYRQNVPQPPHEDLEGVNLWCHNIVRLPEHLQAGSIYSIYWVWDYPTISQDGSVNTEELYTSCIDIDIVAGC
ncbi:hypothetical protein BDV97DRAFT_389871 [Delphinella strobiligena]|nr:hypothetical protein BDV97DRAFT_389871 [Delphinella strobiligena]